jgi:protein HOOK3
MHLERSRVLSDKDTLEKVYQALLEEHRKLQTSYVRMCLLTFALN